MVILCPYTYMENIFPFRKNGDVMIFRQTLEQGGLSRNRNRFFYWLLIHHLSTYIFTPINHNNDNNKGNDKGLQPSSPTSTTPMDRSVNNNNSNGNNNNNDNPQGVREESPPQKKTALHQFLTKNLVCRSEWYISNFNTKNLLQDY